VRLGLGLSFAPEQREGRRGIKKHENEHFFLPHKPFSLKCPRRDREGGKTIIH